MKVASLRLTSTQVANRLAIKEATLYSYVSRGLLHSERSETGGSTFDPLDVEAFSAARRHGSRTSECRAGRPVMVMDSDLTLIEDDQLYFRGALATKLAQRLQFEGAVAHMWKSPDARDDITENFVSRPDVIRAIGIAAAQLGDTERFIDRLRIAVLISGARDPVRHSLGASAVRDAGRQILSTMVDSLPDRQAPAPLSASLAARFWPKLCAMPPSPWDLRLLNATMILCMDHDLAISTMGARVAASAHADPYAAIVAALSTFDGSLHGAASVAAVQMLKETIDSGRAERAISAQLAKFDFIPGFGHIVYKKVDPRAAFLLSAMRHSPQYQRAFCAIDRLSAVILARSPRPANLDLALAALVVGAEMLPDAGQLIFAVSRTVGWISHILDEYQQRAMRLRPASRYIGNAPTQP